MLEGIQLDPFPSTPVSKFKSRSLYLISFLMFFINVSSNVYFTIASFNSTLKDTQNLLTVSTSDIWNMVIDFGSHDLMAIGTHAALLALKQKSEWKLLWHNLQEVTAEHGQLFYGKYRRIVTVALLCLIADAFVTMIRAITVMVYNNERPLLLSLADCISFLSEIYAISGLAVFVTIGWITSIEFEQLYNQLTMAADPIGQRNNSSSRRKTIRTSEDLRRWRRTYVTLTEAMMHIGQCFGLLILVWVVYIFISVIATSFYIVDGMRHDSVMTSPSSMIFLLVRHLVHLLVLATVPVILKQKSLSISRPLRQMRFEDSLLQHQVGIMIMEVMQSPTTITAMDLFPVDLTLIPTVRGYNRSIFYCLK